jgi:hypothetical protein
MAGIHGPRAASQQAWIPAFAGMTKRYFSFDQELE